VKSKGGKERNAANSSCQTHPGGLYIAIQVIDEVKRNHTYFLVYLYECHKLFRILII